MTKPALELTLLPMDRPILFEGLGGRTKLISQYMPRKDGDYFEDKDEINTLKPAHW